MALSGLIQSHLDRPDGNTGWLSPSLMGFPESIHHSAQRRENKKQIRCHRTVSCASLEVEAGEGENDTAGGFEGCWQGMRFRVQGRRVRCWHGGKLAQTVSRQDSFWALGKACGLGSCPKLAVVPALHSPCEMY